MTADNGDAVQPNSWYAVYRTGGGANAGDYQDGELYFTYTDTNTDAVENPVVETNLTATEGDYFYPLFPNASINFDNEYTGDYHIHETGPMVGPIHTKEPHERLYYVSKLPAPPDTTYEDFLASTLANPPSNEPTINKEPNKETSKEQNQILQDEQFQNTEWDGEAGDDHDNHDDNDDNSNANDNCKPFGAPADPASVTPLRIQYFIYRMRNVVFRQTMRTNVRR